MGLEENEERHYGYSYDGDHVCEKYCRRCFPDAWLEIDPKDARLYGRPWLEWEKDEEFRAATAAALQRYHESQTVREGS